MTSDLYPEGLMNLLEGRRQSHGKVLLQKEVLKCDFKKTAAWGNAKMIALQKTTNNCFFGGSKALPIDEVGNKEN